MNFTLTVIDLYLLEGVVALVRVCLGILDVLQEDLVNLTYEETLVFMKSFTLPFKVERKSTLYQMTTDSETFFGKAL